MSESSSETAVDRAAAAKAAPDDGDARLATAIGGLAVVLFGVQVTLAGLLAGSSFLAVATGLAISLGGVLRTFDA